MTDGKLIVFEGINGCGKGTQLDLLHSYIRSSGKAIPIFTTGEPNYFDGNGRMAREMLDSEGNPYSNNLKAVEYFAENRRTHNNIFVPMLKKGIDVLSDRYWHSNFAFQNAQGISYADIAKANKGFRAPNLTFILDVPVNIAFERLRKRDGDNRRKFEGDFDFVNSVRNNYLELGSILPRLIKDKNIFVIDGNRSITDIFEKVKEIYSFF